MEVEALSTQLEQEAQEALEDLLHELFLNRLDESVELVRSSVAEMQEALRDEVDPVLANLNRLQDELRTGQHTLSDEIDTRIGDHWKATRQGLSEVRGALLQPIEMQQKDLSAARIEVAAAREAVVVQLGRQHTAYLQMTGMQHQALQERHDQLAAVVEDLREDLNMQLRELYKVLEAHANTLRADQEGQIREAVGTLQRMLADVADREAKTIRQVHDGLQEALAGAAGAAEEQRADHVEKLTGLYRTSASELQRLTANELGQVREEIAALAAQAEHWQREHKQVVAKQDDDAVARRDELVEVLRDETRTLRLWLGVQGAAAIVLLVVVIVMMLLA